MLLPSIDPPPPLLTNPIPSLGGEYIIKPFGQDRIYSMVSDVFIAWICAWEPFFSPLRKAQIVFQSQNNTFGAFRFKWVHWEFVRKHKGKLDCWICLINSWDWSFSGDNVINIQLVLVEVPSLQGVYLLQVKCIAIWLLSLVLGGAEMLKSLFAHLTECCVPFCCSLARCVMWNWRECFPSHVSIFASYFCHVWTRKCKKATWLLHISHILQV